MKLIEEFGGYFKKRERLAVQFEEEYGVTKSIKQGNNKAFIHEFELISLETWIT